MPFIDYFTIALCQGFVVTCLKKRIVFYLNNRKSIKLVSSWYSLCQYTPSV